MHRRPRSQKGPLGWPNGRKPADSPLAGGVVPVVESMRRVTLPRESGHVMADGQHQIVERPEVLGGLPDGWTVLHDVAWPGRWRASIDQVVIGPSGIYVVATRSWAGRVTIERGVLRHNGRNRLAALRGAVAAAAAVASVWPDRPPAPVHAILSLTGADRPSASFGCVSVCSSDALVETLTSRPRVVAAQQLRIVVSDLRWLLSSASDPRHLAAFAQSQASRERFSALH